MTNHIHILYPLDLLDEITIYMLILFHILLLIYISFIILSFFIVLSMSLLLFHYNIVSCVKYDDTNNEDVICIDEFKRS